MEPLAATISRLPATVWHGLGDLGLGAVLIFLAVVLYRTAPRIEEAAQRAWFPNRQLEGRRVRTVGQPGLIAGFGAVCLVAGMLHLV
jgi:hypothetical protein